MEEDKAMKDCLWVRAIDYAHCANAENKGLCAFDYKSGAEEERLLLLEWVNPKEELPENGAEVLVKLNRKFQMYSVAKWDGEHWWQPIAPMGGVEEGGWIALEEDIIGWRNIEEA